MTEKIAIIGCGNMGGAMARGLVQSGYSSADNILCCDADRAKLVALQRQLSVSISEKIGAWPDEPEVIILAVKPQIVRAVMEQLVASIQRSGTLVISIAAGVGLKAIEGYCRGAERKFNFVRAMPNIACVYSAGISALYGTKAESLALAETIFKTVGAVVRVESEEQLDTVTGLSGSGPGYVFALVEALVQGGIQMGLSPTLALELTTKMIYGSAQMLIQSGEEPAALRDKVTTPGGTTIAGLMVMEQAGVREGLIAAVKAATCRAQEMSKTFTG